MEKSEGHRREEESQRMANGGDEKLNLGKTGRKIRKR